jgi:hypothetical protein
MMPVAIRVHKSPKPEVFGRISWRIQIGPTVLLAQISKDSRALVYDKAGIVFFVS